MSRNVNIGQTYQKGHYRDKNGLKLKTLTLMHIFISVLIHIFNFKKNPLNGLGGVAITNCF